MRILRVVIVLLGCAWVVPMALANRAGAPWPFFVGLGCFWLLVVALSGPLYDAGISIRRKMGMKSFADWGERMRPRILPLGRVALLIMSVISFVFAAI